MDGDQQLQLHSIGWRLVLALAAAMLFPLAIYALITIELGYSDEHRFEETATLARAQAISDAVDARLGSAIATMRVLATIRSIGESNWVEAYFRSRAIARLDPDWQDVALIDLAKGTRVYDLRDPTPGAHQVDRGEAEALAGQSRGNPVFSNVNRTGKSATLDLAMAIGPVDHPRYLLRVALDPALVQRILVSKAPREGVSAVVDRRGMFIARTKAWATRLGTPATIYVRRAIAGGSGGIYSGTTYEGLASYTAFTTSALTGWSVHVAVSSDVFDRPKDSSRAAGVLAAIASLALAGLLIFLVVRLTAMRQAAVSRSQQLQRLETVGKLTGGVAHDFNNMLAIVIGSLELAQRRMANGNTDIVRFIDSAMDGARRAADLTSRLLAFSRRQTLAPVVIDVNALISGMTELLRRTLPQNIRIDFNLDPGLWTALVDPGLLENAILNLAVNARDAMPNGGSLTISTRNVAGGGGGKQDQIQIEVTDSGSGMAPEVVERAFEPFFTTKEVGRGTGLGLSQIHGFAHQSGGTVAIKSALGKGTAVTLSLPRHDSPNAVEPVPTAVGQTADADGIGHEVILLVEDEQLLRDTTAEALRDLGYTVNDAANAEQALALLRARHDIGLLISDIVMPGMNGRELAKKALELNAELRVILISGFDKIQVDGDTSVLRKPFGMAELARRVRWEFDQTNSSAAR